MNAIVLLLTLAAWAGVFLLPGAGWRLLQFLVFGGIGLLLVVFGGFAYWWDSSMRPSVASPLLLICGVLMLLSQAGTFVRGLLESELDVDVTERPRRRR